MDNTIPMQLYTFFIFTFSGVAIGIFFDIFRILRKSFNTSNCVTYIEDFFFWLITGFFFLYILFKFNNGQIRIYILVGLILGIILYILTISKYFINISVSIIKVLKKVLTYPIMLVYRYTRKISKPISFVVINIRKNCKNIVNKEIQLIKSKKIVKKM